MHPLQNVFGKDKVPGHLSHSPLLMYENNICLISVQAYAILFGDGVQKKRGATNVIQMHFRMIVSMLPISWHCLRKVRYLPNNSQSLILVCSGSDSIDGQRFSPFLNKVSSCQTNKK